jgi:hypothetical protein
MARTTSTTEKDTLGLLAMGSIVVNLAQGAAHVNLQQTHVKLAAWYDQLTKQYGLICREYLTLRKVNGDLQKQVREYERIIDGLRTENGQIQKRLAEVKGG